MVYPRTDKVEVVWGGHDPALFCLSLTLLLAPHCRYGARRRADYLPACKGSVDYLAARARPCPELAAASTFACHPPVYEGST